jgi:hypothetical protein
MKIYLGNILRKDRIKNICLYIIFFLVIMIYLFIPIS